MAEVFPGYTPLQVAKHYGFPTQYTGKGQKIGIISLGGQLSIPELTKDFKALRVPMPRLTIKSQNGIPASQNGWPTDETHLDLEVIGSLCPDAAIVVYRGVNDSGFGAAIQQAVDDDCDVISISWGSSERSANKGDAVSKALRAAKAAGITVCAASGDGGSSNHRKKGAAAAASDGLAHVNYPASHPLVLACGGTELHQKGGVYTESVWNNSEGGGGATGGGVSQVFERPHYQRLAGIKIENANPGGGLGRVVPDVAGLAAGGDWSITENGSTVGTGGTSAVAPLWAALFALINEARADAGKPRLGFVNTRLYKLGLADTGFSDITRGSNASPGTPGYSAAEGFDACTGWGVPVGAALLAALR